MWPQPVLEQRGPVHEGHAAARLLGLRVRRAWDSGRGHKRVHGRCVQVRELLHAETNLHDAWSLRLGACWHNRLCSWVEGAGAGMRNESVGVPWICPLVDPQIPPTNPPPCLWIHVATTSPRSPARRISGGGHGGDDQPEWRDYRGERGEVLQRRESQQRGLRQARRDLLLDRGLSCGAGAHRAGRAERPNHSLRVDFIQSSRRHSATTA